jgi:VanZ family protein
MPVGQRGGSAALWLPPIALMALIFGLSAMPTDDVDHGVLYLIVRKAAHFGEYALLTALWWRALRSRTADPAALAGAVAIAVVYAITDEFHQTFVDGRTGSPVDVLIDAGGAATAALLISRYRRKVPV